MNNFFVDGSCVIKGGGGGWGHLFSLGTRKLGQDRHDREYTANSDPAKFDESNELSHTCYPSFLCQFGSYKSPTCSLYGNWHKCLHFLSFHNAHGQEPEFSISEHQDSVEKNH